MQDHSFKERNKRNIYGIYFNGLGCLSDGSPPFLLFACSGYGGDAITSYVTLHYVFHSNYTNIVCA